METKNNVNSATKNKNDAANVTGKFKYMIEAFECDFNLAKEGKKSLSELDSSIRNNDKKTMKDIDLLCELSYLLRYGKAEIRLIQE